MLVLFAGCDLAITKTDTPDPVSVGEPLTYTLNVSNTPADPPPPQGQGGYSQVLVTDTLSASVDFVSVTPSQGTCTPPAAGTSVVSCALGPLALNSSATIEIVVVPQVAGEIQNTATVQGPTSGPVPLQSSPAVTQQQYEGETCDNPFECDPQAKNTTTITTTVLDPAAPTPPDTPAPPEDQYGPDNPGDGQPDDGQPGGGQQPGEDVEDIIGDGVTPGGTGGFPAGNACVNVIPGINAASANNSSQSVGSDTASQTASGDGDAQTISQDEAQDVAQENNTTVDIVQQCAQGSGVNVIGGDGKGTATSSSTDTTGDGGRATGAVARGVSENAANIVDTLDSDNDGVISEAEARSVLESEVPEAMDEADTDANGIVSVAEAEAFASESNDVQPEDSTESSASLDTANNPETISVLPDTGGASLFTLVGGILLVAGGLVARRIVR